MDEFPSLTHYINATVVPGPLRILIYSWNSAAAPICEKLLLKDLIDSRSCSYSGYLWSTIDSFFADWTPEMIDKITKENPDIVVFCNQESLKPGDYWQSHVLPEELPKINYSLVKRTRLMGVGVASYKRLIEHWKISERGLRTSIYCRNNMLHDIESAESCYRSAVGLDFQKTSLCSNPITRNKGATASYLKVPGYGIIAFLNMHLPFNASSLVKYNKTGDPFVRHNYVMETNISFNNMIRDLVHEIVKDRTDIIPSYIFVIGDLNYRIISNIEINDKYPEHSLELDELRQEMKRGNIYPFVEGRGNAGPNFMPTCKMRRSRSPNRATEADYNLGKYKQRRPSYCDRILYNTINDTYKINCLEYDRYDWGNMAKASDHAGIYGLYQIS